jgi:Tfp pilus assembly protein PilX
MTDESMSMNQTRTGPPHLTRFEVAVDQRERGVVLIVALLLMVLLFTLGAALLTMAETEGVIAANDVWSEGSFYAAEAAVQQAIDAIPGSVAAVPVTNLGTDYRYRTGGRLDTSAQPPAIVQTVNGSGFAVSSSAGYNSTGFVFDVYEINGTGMGPRSAIREVEVQVEYGPRAN